MHSGCHNEECESFRKYLKKGRLKRGAEIRRGDEEPRVRRIERL